MPDEIDDRARRLVDDLSTVPLPSGPALRRRAAARHRARLAVVTVAALAVVGGVTAALASAPRHHQVVRVVTTTPPTTAVPPTVTSPTVTSPDTTPTRPSPTTVTRPTTTVPSAGITSPTVTSTPTTSPAVTTVPTTGAPASTSVPTTGVTAPGRLVLAPAVTAPVVDECSTALQVATDGTAGPDLCPDGRINVKAWAYFARFNASFMALGAGETEAGALAAMCQDAKSLPTMEQVSKLTATYYGWSFVSNPDFAQWPFYPKPAGNECP